MDLMQFNKGQRVRYIGHAHGRHGQFATVVRPVKSRGCVTLRFDDPHAPWFDALPTNVAFLIPPVAQAQPLPRA